MTNEVPKHLQKYVVVQDVESYSARDHAVWRFSMRQLKSYLSTHAHPSYVDGLEKTGIQIDSIPKIQDINKKLNRFGWSAIPVSGFIPPGAFMEFQSLGYLPIASGIRTFDHILYTPAPDIIHEAAGHAPIIADPEFAQYLKNYAEVANKAIVKKEDIKLYEAIRELSDIKEHPSSTEAEIAKCEEKLHQVSNNMGSPSEASLLGRMNWWTAEYGLIGSLDNPKIFGAGLLSSLGESENSLSSRVKKIALSVECINYEYDITEQQPQLFVTPDFAHLTKVLKDLSLSMAFTLGGAESVEKAIVSRTINTIELNSGVQVSGKVAEQIKDQNKTLFFKISNPTQICVEGQQLPGQGVEQHNHGYSCPLGTINNQCLSELNTIELEALGVQLHENCHLKYDSGFNVNGRIADLVFNNKQLILIKFTDCTVTYKDNVYFEPSWGDFDMAVGSTVTSVFRGPADSLSYITMYDYPAKVIPEVNISEQDHKIFCFYQKIRDMRDSQNTHLDSLASAANQYIEQFPQEWLAGIELLELSSHINGSEKVKEQLLAQLEKNKKHSAEVAVCISKGIERHHQII